MAAAGPSFLGIGAQKAGTTWLHRMLSRHPDVGMPEQKELHFWDRETPDAAAVASYMDRFAGLRGKARGEITPSYAILPPERIAVLRGYLPDLRLIYILRDPVERAWSHAKMDLGKHLRRHKQLPPDMDAWLEAHFRSEESLQRGDYATCLANWGQHYGRDQLQVSIYEEVFAAPRDFLKACAVHLGVDPGFYDGVQAVELADSVYPEGEVIKTSRQELPPETRGRHAALLLELYAPLIERLSSLLGRDLSSIWARPQA